MKQKVIRINESDIERLVKKILKEEKIDEISIEQHKRENLKPAIADYKGKKYLVIVDEENKVQAVGPAYDSIKGISKEQVCRISDSLIDDLFSLEEDVMNEYGTRDFSNIQVINFCPIKK
jgi:hypothetical protein